MHTDKTYVNLATFPWFDVPTFSDRYRPCQNAIAYTLKVCRCDLAWVAGF
jgi:hypothetical protein